MEDERIDFSALDPSRNELGWRRTVEGIVARALEQRRRRLSVERQLLSWARPVLVIAIGLCILSWTATLIGGTERVERDTRPAPLTLARWAANHQMPPAGDLLSLLRGEP
jgi:hypothetical protein